MLADSIRAAGLGKPSALVAPNVLQKPLRTPSTDVVENALRSTASEFGGTVTGASRGVDDTKNVWLRLEISY